MLFAIGTRVKFLHTKDEGVVKSMLDNGMVNVYIAAADMEIPVWPEDLIRADDPFSQPKVKAKIVKGKQVKKVVEPPRPAIQTQYSILKSLGIQIAFDPIFKKDGTPDKYLVYLINDTRADVIFAVTLYLVGEMEEDWNGKLAATSIEPLGDLLYDELNDAPVYEVNCWKITTAGKGEKLHKSLKIKAKQFFKNIRTAPLLNKKVHHYRLFENLNTNQQSKAEDLKTYTQRSVKPSKYRDHNQFTKISLYDSKAFAEFSTEIDLHIQELTNQQRKMSNTEIVRMQLAHFDEYIAQAIRLGVPRVFIIHGLGKGRLRDEIASRLLQNREVKTFKNEFHPKYGWGATEVIF